MIGLILVNKHRGKRFTGILQDVIVVISRVRLRFHSRAEIAAQPLIEIGANKIMIADDENEMTYIGNWIIIVQPVEQRIRIANLWMIFQPSPKLGVVLFRREGAREFGHLSSQAMPSA